MCGDKRIYKSRKEALRVMRGVGKLREVDLRAYECPRCAGWHLTKKHGNY